MKDFFKTTETIYNSAIRETALLLSSVGIKVLIENFWIMKRWAVAINGLSHMETNHNLDFPPSLPEIDRAMHRLSSGEARDSDSTSTEVYKYGGAEAKTKSPAIFQEMWRQ
ncbi:hypothetical protein SprV_0902699500 [Sparganum proliferum]